jgi:hypothetical protein
MILFEPFLHFLGQLDFFGVTCRIGKSFDCSFIIEPFILKLAGKFWNLVLGYEPFAVICSCNFKLGEALVLCSLLSRDSSLVSSSSLSCSLASCPISNSLFTGLSFSGSMVSWVSFSASSRSFGYPLSVSNPFRWVILYKVLFYVLPGYVFGAALGFLLRVLRVIGAGCFWLRFWGFDLVLGIMVVLVVIFGCI